MCVDPGNTLGKWSKKVKKDQWAGWDNLLIEYWACGGHKGNRQQDSVM